MRLPINLMLEDLELPAVLLHLYRQILHQEIEEMSILDRVTHLAGKILNFLLVVYAALNSEMILLISLALLKILTLCRSNNLLCCVLC